MQKSHAETPSPSASPQALLECEEQFLVPLWALAELKAFPDAPSHLLTQHYFPRDEGLIKAVIPLLNKENNHPNSAMLTWPSRLGQGVKVNRCRVRRVITTDGNVRYFFTAKTNQRPTRIELETPIDAELAGILIANFATEGCLRKSRRTFRGMLGDTPIIMAIDLLLRIGLNQDPVQQIPFAFCEVEVPIPDDLPRLLDPAVTCTFDSIIRQGLHLLPGDTRFKALSMTRMAMHGATKKFWDAVSHAACLIFS